MRKILAILLLMPIVAYSQNLPDSTNFKDTLTMSEVVIYSVRANDNTPVSEKTFYLYQLQKSYQGQDIPFFLNKQNPSIMVYSDGGNYNGYQYFRLRGIDQTRINMTLNGVPLNEPEDQGAYFSNYPDYTKNISSMQVQRGIGLSSNGVASYGGSINFESVNLKSDKTADINIGYGSFNTKRLSVGFNTKVNDKIYLYGRYSKINSDGYRDHSGINGQTFFFSAGYFGKKDIVKITGFLGESKNQMAYLASSVDDIKNNRKNNPLTSNENDNFNQNHIQLQHTRELNKNLKWTNTAYYTYLLGSYDVYFNPDMLYFKLNSDFYGIISNLSYNKNNFDLNIGVHANNYQRTHKMSIKPDISTNLYSNTGWKNEQSAFLKASYKLGKFTPYLDLQVRNVNFKYVPESSYNLSFSPINWFFFNPKAGLSYKKDEHITFYTCIGQTHREPTRNDMFGGADDIDPNNYALVSDFSRVKPESVIDFEIGTKYRYGKFSGNMNFFNMEFKNEIAAIGQLSYIGLPLRKNVASSYRRGVEMDFKYTPIEKIKIWGNGTFMLAKIREYSSDVDSVTYTNVTPLLTPKYMANLGVNYSICKYFEIGLDAKYIATSYLDNTDNENLKLPEYIIANFSSTIHITSDFNIIVNVNNILNTKYYSSGYGQVGIPYYFVAPTRNFFVTLNKTF